VQDPNPRIFGSGYLFAQPETVVDGEGVDGDGEMLGVDLGELLTAYHGEIQLNDSNEQKK